MRKFRCVEDLDLSTGNVKKGDVFNVETICSYDSIVREDGSFICHVNSIWGRQRFKEIIEEIKPKDLLETGMVVELRNYSRYFLINGNLNNTDRLGIIFINNKGFMPISSYDTELKCIDSSSFDVIKIYKPKRIIGLEWMLEYDSHDLIWERKEPKTVKMSASEVLEKLGYSKDDKLEIIVD